MRSSGDRPTDAAGWHRPFRAFARTVITGWLHARFRVELHGEEHLRHSRGALIVFNHRRDSDGPVLSAILLGRGRARLAGVEPFFVAREDLFRRGFLGQYLETWPPVLRGPLSALSVAPVLRAMRLRPMRRIPEHSLEELLSDVLEVLGNPPLKEVLRESWVVRFADATGREPDEITVADALRAPRDMLGRRHAFRRLTPAAFRRLAPFERDLIASQLRLFVELVDAGESVLLAPEGAVSPDGSFGRSRLALHHLVNAPARSPHMLPVSLSYDALAPGRPRVLVRFGEPIPDLRGLSRRDTDIAARRALLEHWMINISHLVAHYLNSGGTRAGGDAPRTAEEFVVRMVDRCRTLDAPLDPALLDPAVRVRRTAECLAFLDRRGPSEGRALLEFLGNELDSIAEAHTGLLSRDWQ